MIDDGRKPVGGVLPPRPNKAAGKALARVGARQLDQMSFAERIEISTALGYPPLYGSHVLVLRRLLALAEVGDYAVWAEDVGLIPFDEMDLVDLDSGSLVDRTVAPPARDDALADAWAPREGEEPAAFLSRRGREIRESVHDASVLRRWTAMTGMPWLSTDYPPAWNPASPPRVPATPSWERAIRKDEPMQPGDPWTDLGARPFAGESTLHDDFRPRARAILANVCNMLAPDAPAPRRVVFMPRTFHKDVTQDAHEEFRTALREGRAMSLYVVVSPLAKPDDIAAAWQYLVLTAENNGCGASPCDGGVLITDHPDVAPDLVGMADALAHFVIGGPFGWWQPKDDEDYDGT